jgi:putative ABC transport system substrate-binding protein
LRESLPVVGFLNSASAEGYAEMAAAFRDGLAQAGFRAGENVAIEYRWASDQYARLPELAADLVARKVAVVFANSPAIAPAKAATSTIPIVFTSGDDPVRLGFVPNLNRPGANVTGVAILAGELGAKRLQLLHELVPKATTVAVLVNSDFGPSARFYADVQSAAPGLGLTVRLLPANNRGEIDAAFAALHEARADALLVGPGPFLDSRRRQLVGLAEKAAIPAAYETRATALAGGLASYGARVADGYRRAGFYVGRILKGENPGELPIVLATDLELVINLTTARKLGLEVPAPILARADEIVE